jgi:outer membrane protein TolC
MPGRRWWLIFLMALILSGCGRPFYRRQADKEVYGLIGCAATDPRWELKDYSITPKPDSRMFDPDDPDRPPMPPDDPTSHELMHCVDGKRGWRGWHRNGDTPFVENPFWLAYLPRDDSGALLLDRASAMRMALLHSREYQTALESLYLSALDVTFQRFRFQVQFYGRNSTYFTADGPDRGGVGGTSSSLLEERNSLQMRKLTATGGELVAGAANSLVWQFAGPDQYAAATLLDFSMLQPLLRAGGRAVVLENLTEAERALLANVRQMEHFRHGFYGQIIAGLNPGVPPSRGGLGLGALQPTVSGGSGGMFSLLETQIRIRNQRANVAGLRFSLDQLEAFYEAGRIDNLQVDQARQALFNAQIQLASLKQNYQDELDRYKITLGLPPQLEVRIDDPLLRPFDMIDPHTTALQDEAGELLQKLRDPNAPLAPADRRAATEELPLQAKEMLAILEDDLRRLDAAAPARREMLGMLASRPELQNGDVDPGAVDPAKFEGRLKAIHADFTVQRSRLLATLAEIEQLAHRNDNRAAAAEGGDERVQKKEALAALFTQLSGQLTELSLTQARARVETAVLEPIVLEDGRAMEIARQCRLDWMNARAALVDSWRQIEVAANALKSDLDVTFSGDISTLGNSPLKFRGTTGRLRAGVQFDPPLTRLIERNAYREALIAYQQARRQYYAYEDRVRQGLRNSLRTINRYQLDFELRREAVHVAVSQVDVTQLRLLRPPKPGETGVFGATTARDLVQAYTGLLAAQNSFLSAWVDYEVQRLNLDFELGTMRLDAQGNWIDPGPIMPEYDLPPEMDNGGERAEPVPPPPPSPKEPQWPEVIPLPTNETKP